MNTIILKNNNLEVVIGDIGATIIRLITKDRDFKDVDVVLGYENLDEYITQDGYLGATVGRVCNRIALGKFSLNNKDYQLAINNGPNALHGGIEGFSYKRFDIIEKSNEHVLLRYISKDMEEGYPGELVLDVSYKLIDNELKTSYFATCSKDTLINITNHSYFNLSNENTILDHSLMIKSDYMVSCDTDGLATGELISVTNKPYDYRTLNKISKALLSDDEHIKIGNGLDHPFIFNDKTNQIVLYSDKSGIEMTVNTTLPQAQIYSANYLDGRLGKYGNKYYKNAGICIETQYMPDAIHLESKPSTILKKGEEYNESTSYIFKVK